MTMNFNSGGAIGAVSAIDALGGVQAVNRREGGSASGGDHGGHGTTFSKAMRDARGDTEASDAASQTTRAPDKARKGEDKRAVARDDDATPTAVTTGTLPADAPAAVPDPAMAAAGVATPDPSVDKALLAADGQAGADAANAALRAGCGLPTLGLPAAGTTVAGVPAGKSNIPGAMPAVRADQAQTAIGASGEPATVPAAGTPGQTLVRLSASGELPGKAGAAGFQLPSGPAGASGNAGVSDTRVRPAQNAGKGLPVGAPASTQLTTDLPTTATVQMAQTMTQTHDWATMKVEGIRLQAEPGAGQSSTVDLAAAVQAGASMSLVQNQSSEAAAPATQAAIAVPMDAPEFAGALAKQVGYWINGGVQNAEIHLNPAEMGPISVQMTLQGGDARVDFSAVSAQTRQVLQDSIPQLAQMLEQAGVSLLSADVSAQQGRSQQREAPRQSSPSGGLRAGVQALDALGSAGAVSAAALSRPRPGAPGRLDLYA